MECISILYVFAIIVVILQMAYIGERVRCRGGRCELSCRVLGAYFELLLAVVLVFLLFVLCGSYGEIFQEFCSSRKLTTKR